MSVGKALTEQDVTDTASFLGVGLAELWAVVSVETRGYGFWVDRNPAILFERHFFSRLTGGAFDRSHPDISDPQWGGYGPSSAQYSRLRRAAELDYDAALMSASWGLGQVMGANAESLDYPSIRDFVTRARASEGEQLTAMARFIDDRGLTRALRGHDWTFFARRYNGPSFARNQYDRRLAQAFARYSNPGRLPDWNVRQAQLYLVYTGYLDLGGVDGVIGRMTRSALDRFLLDAGRVGVDVVALRTVPDDLLAVVYNRVATLPYQWPLEGLPRGGGAAAGVV